MKIILIVLKLILLLNSSNGKSVNINRIQMNLIEASMDPKTDPCENFYQYACGNWDNVHTDISKYYDSYQMTEYMTNKEMINLLAATEGGKKRPKLTTAEPKFVTTVRAYYKSCVALKQVHLIKYLKWLEDTEHIDMMLTESKNSSTGFDWLQHLAIMNKYGLQGVFLEETYQKSLGVLVLNRPLRERGYETVTLDLFNYIARRILSTENTNTKTFGIKWKEFSTFENDVMRLHIMASDTSTNATFDMATLSDIPWLYRYVNMLLQNTGFPIRVTDIKILVKDIEYVTQLYDLLQQYNQQFLCEYLKIRFLWHLLLVSYPANNTPDSCALKARTYMYLATDYLFERQHVDLVQNIPKIQFMFSNIKDHYSKMLLTNPNGFTSTVMNFLLAKLKKTQLMVGLLPRNNTQQVLESLYRSIQLNKSGSESFYGNQMKMLKFKTNSAHLMQMPTVQDSLKYFEHTKKISPYYIRSWNMIVLPITTLQLPIYDPKLSGLFTYSSLGYILGHELTHGFDTVGIKYDPKGRISNNHHDVINSNARYQRNLACLRRLNSSNIDEKIADVTGFRVAFKTYFELNPRTRVKTTHVNGMKLPIDKLFFLNFAQFRCTSFKDTNFEDPSHGTDEERTIDALSHSPEFVKTFECPKYTDMHVYKSCQLWRR